MSQLCPINSNGCLSVHQRLNTLPCSKKNVGIIVAIAGSILVTIAAINMFLGHHISYISGATGSLLCVSTLFFLIRRIVKSHQKLEQKNIFFNPNAHERWCKQFWGNEGFVNIFLFLEIKALCNICCVNKQTLKFSKENNIFYRIAKDGYYYSPQSGINNEQAMIWIRGIGRFIHSICTHCDKQGKFILKSIEINNKTPKIKILCFDKQGKIDFKSTFKKIIDLSRCYQAHMLKENTEYNISNGDENELLILLKICLYYKIADIADHQKTSFLLEV